MIDPITRFGELLDRATRAGIPEPTAMALATADRQGRPSVRMLLLKGFDEEGFVFYTNLESRKAGELIENPRAALCFHWQPLESQVRIDGPVTRVTDAVADAYFATRPRESQISAWASRQSQPLDSFGALESRLADAEARFAAAPVPRPPFWSGFLLSPERIEFWRGRPGRLHERELHVREPDGRWRVELLYP